MFGGERSMVWVVWALPQTHAFHEPEPWWQWPCNVYSTHTPPIPGHVLAPHRRTALCDSDLSSLGSLCSRASRQASLPLDGPSRLIIAMAVALTLQPTLSLLQAKYPQAPHENFSNHCPALSGLQRPSFLLKCEASPPPCGQQCTLIASF